MSAPWVATVTDADMTGTYLLYLWVALAIVLVVGLLFWLGWRNRKRRQSGIPVPEQVPAELLEAEPLAAAEGMVIGTTKAADYLDRVAVHRLGIRVAGRIEAHRSGVVIFRNGAPNWFIPAQDLTHVRTAGGMVGKFVERDGALMIGWQLGAEELETGFRARSPEDNHHMMNTVNTIVSTTGPREEEIATQ